METLIVAAIASVVVFSLFFCVFLLRQRVAGRRRPLEGCGGTGGQCHCGRAGSEEAVGLREGPLGAGYHSARCPHGASEDRLSPESHDHRPA